MTPTQLFSSYTDIQERYSAEKMRNRQHEIVLEQVNLLAWQASNPTPLVGYRGTIPSS